MKTLFYSLLTFAFVLSGFGAKAVTTPPGDETTIKITLNIELGKKSRNCERFGFCDLSVDVDIERQIGPIGENTVVGTAWIENGKLRISFDRSTMTETTYNKHFSNGKFQLEEDYVLPSEVAFALGVRSYTVRTGTYVVPKTIGENTAISVTF